MIGILFLIFFSKLLVTQSGFDEYLDTYDSFARLWVFGYENIGNKGLIKGCCFSINKTVCRPCKYRVVYRCMQSVPESFSSANYLYELGTFSKAAQSLFEPMYFEKMYSYQNLFDSDINFFNTERISSNAVETMQKIQYYWYGDYEFDGAYGIFNRIKAWVILSFDNKGYRNTANFNLVIQTIKFKEYKLANGDCCSGDPDDESGLCLTPCSFSVALNDRFSDFVKSANILPLSISSTYTYNLTLVYFTFSINRDNRIKIRFMSDKNNEMDIMELKNLNIFKKRSYYFNNVIGVNGYVHANISLNLNCFGSSGPLCSRRCTEYKYVETCDKEYGNPVCLNGATDGISCQNYTLSCQNTSCLNNGTCKILNNDQLICICENGFSGQYCEEINCRFNCQGRGLCQSPNKCICEYPFFGNDCEFQECSNEIKNMCQNDGKCYHDSLESKCMCDKSKSTGKYCEIPLCDINCINGICVKDPSDINARKCLCYENFSGPSCEIKTGAILFTAGKNSAVLPLLIILAIATSILLILSFLKYMGILFTPYRNSSFKDEAGENV